LVSEGDLSVPGSAAILPQALEQLTKMVSGVLRQMSDMATQLAGLSLRISEVECQPPALPHPMPEYPYGMPLSNGTNM